MTIVGPGSNVYRMKNKGPVRLLLNSVVFIDTSHQTYSHHHSEASFPFGIDPENDEDHFSEPYIASSCHVSPFTSVVSQF